MHTIYSFNYKIYILEHNSKISIKKDESFNKLSSFKLKSLHKISAVDII